MSKEPLSKELAALETDPKNASLAHDVFIESKRLGFRLGFDTPITEESLVSLFVKFTKEQDNLEEQKYEVLQALARIPYKGLSFQCPAGKQTTFMNGVKELRAIRYTRYPSLEEIACVKLDPIRKMSHCSGRAYLADDIGRSGPEWIWMQAQLNDDELIIHQDIEVHLPTESDVGGVSLPLAGTLRFPRQELRTHSDRYGDRSIILEGDVLQEILGGIRHPRMLLRYQSSSTYGPVAFMDVPPLSPRDSPRDPCLLFIVADGALCHYRGVTEKEPEAK